MRHLLIILSFIVLFASCKKDALIPTPVPINPIDPVTFNDISYGTQGLQKMDIYLPGGRSQLTTKTIVVIHGGAWIEGDKAEMQFVVDSIKKRNPGYAFVNLNYRLAINGAANIFPAQELDVKAAIDFYLAKTTEYKVSNDLILLGASAGAHLALLHAYKNDPAKHVKAVVDFYGPTDLVAMYNENLILQFGLIIVIGNSYSGNASSYIQSSPINFITAQSPPTIVFHGLIDDLVPPAQSTLLIDKLNSAGVINKLVTYPNEGHGFSDAGNTDALNKIIPFLYAYVK